MPVQKHHLLMLRSVKLKSWMFNELIVFKTLLSAHKHNGGWVWGNSMIGYEIEYSLGYFFLYDTCDVTSSDDHWCGTNIKQDKWTELVINALDSFCSKTVLISTYYTEP